MIFPHPTQLILADCCPLLVAVIILVFLPPFQDLSPLLSLSSPSFLEEWQMQRSTTQSNSVADSKRLNLRRRSACSLAEEESWRKNRASAPCSGAPEVQRARSLLLVRPELLRCFCK